MRIAIALVLTLAAAGCKKKPVEAAPSPFAQGAPAPSEPGVPGVAAPAEPTPPEPTAAPSDQPSRTTPPTAAEIRAQVTPALPEIGKCIGKNAPAGDKGPFTVRLVVIQDGTVGSAGIANLPAARDCVYELLGKLQFAPWRGLASNITLSVDKDGQPVSFEPTDGSTRPAP